MAKRQPHCDRMAKLVASGLSVYTVAKRLGTSTASVSSACKVRGVKVIGLSGRGRTKQGDAMARLVSKGASYAEAARKFGVSVTTVRKACLVRGVKSERSMSK